MPPAPLSKEPSVKLVIMIMQMTTLSQELLQVVILMSPCCCPSGLGLWQLIQNDRKFIYSRREVVDIVPPVYQCRKCPS